MNLTLLNLTTPLIGPISLTIPGGQCTAVMGASGAGKSLLLRAVVDLDANQGSVHLDNQLRESMPATDWRRRVALVPAESGWWSSRVVDHFQPDASVRDHLSSVGLPDAAEWDVSRLSTGERHRIAIARALQHQPNVLLLDEPTAALNPEATLMIESMIEQQCAHGVAVLLVTHDPAQAERVASATCYMADGQLSESQPL